MTFTVTTCGFWRFMHFYLDRTVARGEWDQERSVSQDSNSGSPKRNGARSRRTAHEAIGADMMSLFREYSDWPAKNKGDEKTERRTGASPKEMERC